MTTSEGCSRSRSCRRLPSAHPTSRTLHLLEIRRSCPFVPAEPTCSLLHTAASPARRGGAHAQKVPQHTALPKPRLLFSLWLHHHSPALEGGSNRPLRQRLLRWRAEFSPHRDRAVPLDGSRETNPKRSLRGDYRTAPSSVGQNKQHSPPREKEHGVM